MARVCSGLVRRSRRGSKALRRLLRVNHVLGDVREQIGLPVMVIQLSVHAIDFHIKLATLEPLRVNWVLTL